METPGKFIEHTPNSMGLANTAVLASLFDRLLTKGILSKFDVADILNSAHRHLAVDSTIISVRDAMNIVSQLRATYQNIEP